MIKYVFSDLDNTLLTTDKRVSSKNAQTVKDIQEKGVHFMVSSGRMPFCFEQYEDKLDLSSYISCNGAIIKLDGKIINDEPLSKSDALKLVEFAIEKKMYARIFARNWLYMLHPEKDSFNSFFYVRQSAVNDSEAIKVTKNLDIYKVCFHDPDKKLLDEIRQEIMGMGLNVDSMYSGPNFLEVFHKGESKGNAILKICEATSTKLEETLAMGDAENDLSMLKVAGVAACPTNSLPEVKQICDYISDLTCDEDAVSQILEKYIKNA